MNNRGDGGRLTRAREERRITILHHRLNNKKPTPLGKLKHEFRKELSEIQVWGEHAY